MQQVPLNYSSISPDYMTSYPKKKAVFAVDFGGSSLRWKSPQTYQ